MDLLQTSLFFQLNSVIPNFDQKKLPQVGFAVNGRDSTVQLVGMNPRISLVIW
jgi:hypothetical protein